jgi:hypothetical protein
VLRHCLRGNRKAFELFLEERTEIAKRCTVHVMKDYLRGIPDKYTTIVGVYLRHVLEKEEAKNTYC